MMTTITIKKREHFLFTVGKVACLRKKGIRKKCLKEIKMNMLARTLSQKPKENTKNKRKCPKEKKVAKPPLMLRA